MSLVAVVLLVLVVVALGMRSMNRRESSLPPERLKQMAEKEEMTHARSTDEFAAHEPRMNNFSPDFSPIDEPKPKPVRTGQRGKRGVDEWGNPSSDVEDEEFWANIRSDAEEGGFGAGGTVAARKASARPVERERPAAAPAGRPAAKREPVAADPNAATVQAPLPQRPVPAAQRPVPAAAAASANLADLVEPVQRQAPSAADLADQRTMTFSAPTPDVMTILGAGAQQVPATPQVPAARPDPLSTGGSFPATSTGGYQAGGHGSFPANPISGNTAASPLSSGSFPVAPPTTPIHAAPTSDPFPAYNETSWTGQSAATTSGSWAASPDILDDPAPGSYTPSGPSGSWPAFEPQQPAATRSSYEVRSGWAVADDSDALTGPTPASSTPTVPGRAVSAYDDVLSAPPAAPASMHAYETGDYTAAPPATGAGWPEPPAGAPWPTYGEMYGAPPQAGAGRQGSGGHRHAPEQEHPDYYR
ncbi:hypothetical protein HII36_43305 [Nonomuraea sp. NN258]|uniref:hypothetical protein n=1 Tax=Nonomuraea antri TaxID=2730852 RepID=UPI001569EEDE|nr:hypothetical protein [Nonomuraea antri]NRQ38606.1 hypothetical protein [Nonomuraea antri]